MRPIMLVCVCVLVPALGQQTMYSVKNYPDPVDRFEACGRPSPSFVCDPAEILSTVDANAIDDLVKDIYNETTVPCYTSGPRATRRRGYLVMVAIMPKMERYFTGNSTEYTRTSQFREARYFSYYLGQPKLWGKHSSHCNEMVIILYSVDDNVLYTSTQVRARDKLTDERVRDTAFSAMTRHYPFSVRNRGGTVLNYIVRKYGEALREDIVNV